MAPILSVRKYASEPKVKILRCEMRAWSRGESSSISELEWMKFVERRDKHQIQTLIVILKSTTALSKLTGDISMKSVFQNNFF